MKLFGDGRLGLEDHVDPTSCGEKRLAFSNLAAWWNLPPHSSSLRVCIPVSLWIPCANDLRLIFLGLRPHFWHALVWSRTSADLPCLKRSNVGVLKLGESGSWGKSIRYLLDPFTGMVGQTLLDMSGSGILQVSPHKHQLNYQEGNQYAVLTATSFELEWWLAKTSPWFCAAWWQCRFLRPWWSKQWLLLPFFLIGSQHIQFWIGFWLPHLCSPLWDKESRIAQPAGPDHLHFARDLPGELWISGPLQRVGLFCWPAKVGSWRSLFGHAECCIRYWVS